MTLWQLLTTDRGVIFVEGLIAGLYLAAAYIWLLIWKQNGRSEE